MPKTLLVVDESKTIREASRLALAGEGWFVVEATSAAEAFREIVSSSPDAVLCDADLAGAGYSFCREMRGIPEAREIPILLMGAAVDHHAAVAAGAGSTVPKPFSSDELAEALRDAIALQAAAASLDAAPSFTDEEALTLEELSAPFSPDDSSSARPAEATIEIIDLSEEDDFEDLELLEDLEPVTVSPASPSEEPGWDATAKDTPTAAKPVTPVAQAPADDTFDLSGFSEAELSGIDFLDSETSETSGAAPEPEVQEPGAGVEFPEDLGFGLSRIPPAERPEEAASPAALVSREEELVETPDSYLPLQPTPDSEVGDFGEPSAEALSAPTLPAAGLDAIEANAREAVREALARGLSAETLAPVIEQIVERVVWEVVPQLAERLIREAIEKLKNPPHE